MNISIQNFTSSVVYLSNNLIIYGDLLMFGFRNGLICLNLLFGVPTRFYILWIIAQERRIQSEFFNVNLTICDLIQSGSGLFYLLQGVTDLELLQHFLQGLSDTGRPLFQCLICVERYLAVVHPITFLKFKPLRYRVTCCTAVWMITLGSCLVITIILVSDLKAYTWFFSVQYLFFLSIQLFCLVAVLRALKQSGPGGRNEENQIKRRAFHLILITTVTLVIMFAPFIVTGLLCILQLIEQKDISLLWFLSICCYVLAGFVQPVLYLHRDGKLFFFCSTFTRCINGLYVFNLQ